MKRKKIIKEIPTLTGKEANRFAKKMLDIEKQDTFSKDKQLEDEIESLYQEGTDGMYGDIIDDIENKSNPLQINALESLQKMGELKAELKGRKEVRQELKEKIMQEIDDLIVNSQNTDNGIGEFCIKTSDMKRLKQNLNKIFEQ